MYPGDQGIARTGALGAFLGIGFAIPVLLFDPATALGLAAASAVGVAACGLIGAEGIPVPEDLDPPSPTLRLGAEVGGDEIVLGLASITMGVYSGGGQSAVAREIGEALDWYEDNGWLKTPSRFHEDPPPLEDADIVFDSREVAGLPIEVMSFDSGYAVRPEAPGGQRYMGYAPNRRAYAWVLRGDEEAPWLVNVHGLTMGQPWLDLKLLQADMLHRSLGLNLVFPVLPLHGPRALSRISGRGYLTGNAMDTIHAQTQAIWDIRRIIGWLWKQGSDRIGIHGVSLGGFTTALVASLEQGLRCAIAGIPAADAAWLVWWHASAAARRSPTPAGSAWPRASTRSDSSRCFASSPPWPWTLRSPGRAAISTPGWPTDSFHRWSWSDSGSTGGNPASTGIRVHTSPCFFTMDPSAICVRRRNRA